MIAAPLKYSPPDFDPIPAERDSGTGLDSRTVDYLSSSKGEPDWLRQQRHEALHAFAALPLELVVDDSLEEVHRHGIARISRGRLLPRTDS